MKKCRTRVFRRRTADGAAFRASRMSENNVLVVLSGPSRSACKRLNEKTKKKRETIVARTLITHKYAARSYTHDSLVPGDRTGGGGTRVTIVTTRGSRLRFPFPLSSSAQSRRAHVAIITIITTATTTTATYTHVRVSMAICALVSLGSIESRARSCRFFSSRSFDTGLFCDSHPYVRERRSPSPRETRRSSPSRRLRPCGVPARHAGRAVHHTYAGVRSTRGVVRLCFDVGVTFTAVSTTARARYVTSSIIAYDARGAWVSAARTEFNLRRGT